VAEIKGVEVFKSNQKVYTLATKYIPSSIAVGPVVAVGGGEVCLIDSFNRVFPSDCPLGWESSLI
jgi:hypothetical protein